MSRGRLTLDLGVRYDRQSGKALPSTSLANPAFPNLVPGIHLRRLRHPVHLEQRLAARRHHLRARRGAQDHRESHLQPVRRPAVGNQRGICEPGLQPRLDHLSLDRSERRRLRSGQDEVNTAVEISSSNPSPPPIEFDPALKAPTTQSVVAGVERELRPNLAVQATYSYSRTSNCSATRPPISLLALEWRWPTTPRARRSPARFRPRMARPTAFPPTSENPRKSRRAAARSS